MRWKSEWAVPSVIGAISFGIGVGVGVGIEMYRNKKKPEPIRKSTNDITNSIRYKRIEESLKEIRNVIGGTGLDFQVREDDINQLRLAPIDLTPIGPSQEVIDALWAAQNSQERHPSNVGLPPTNVFPETEEDDWSYEEEIKHRTPDVPYIIHRDEFFNEEMDCSQSTLTFYQGDEVLTDELDVPIYNSKKVVGELIFGKGSQDPSIVYIRNENLMAEYEVILDHGHFQVEILGQEIEHNYNSQKSALHKFKEE